MLIRKAGKNAFQKYGRASDTFLQEKAHKLITVLDLKLYSGREMKIKQCPVCKIYYLFLITVFCLQKLLKKSSPVYIIQTTVYN
jgi:hypothetical protein